MPKEIQLLAEEKEKIFRKDPFNSVLNTHKLHGRFEDFWSFSVDFKHRIVFEFGSDNAVYFHSIGGHSVYK